MVAPKPTYFNLFMTAAADRRRQHVRCIAHCRSLVPSLLDVGRFNVAVQLNGNGNCMSRQHRHPHRMRHYRQIRRVENLLALGDQLGFLARATQFSEPPDACNNVEGYLRRIKFTPAPAVGRQI